MGTAASKVAAKKGTQARKPVVVRFPLSQHRALKVAAALNDRSFNQEVVTRLAKVEEEVKEQLLVEGGAQ